MVTPATDGGEHLVGFLRREPQHLRSIATTTCSWQSAPSQIQWQHVPAQQRGDGRRRRLGDEQLQRGGRRGSRQLVHVVEHDHQRPAGLEFLHHGRHQVGQRITAGSAQVAQQFAVVVGEVDDGGRDVQQQVRGIVVEVVEPHPGERTLVGVVPQRRGGGFAVAGRRRDDHDVTPGRGFQPREDLRPVDDPVGDPGPADRRCRNPGTPVPRDHLPSVCRIPRDVPVFAYWPVERRTCRYLGAPWTHVRADRSAGALQSALTREWFAGTFVEPTPAQAQAWKAIADGDNTLVIAPTGSGKTLAAFLWAIDGLVREPQTDTPGTRVLYVSPLKALAVDVERNLRTPLTGIARIAERTGQPPPAISVGVRSGDTTPSARRELIAKPPDILITTPESLFLMLTSAARDDAGQGADGDRRRGARRRGHQARRAPGAVAGAPRRDAAAAGPADRAVGDRAPARGGGAVPVRHRPARPSSRRRRPRRST